MAIRVRRHKRQLASGKTVTVRQHEREGDAPDGMVRRPDNARGWAVPPPAEAQQPPAAVDWWADDEPEQPALSPRETLHAARQALEENARREEAAGIDWETDEFLRLNHAVIEAEKGVRWWGR
jgi:hypothetical protein